MKMASSSGQRRVASVLQSLNHQCDPSDVVIVSAVRTPITKAKRGAFKDVTPDVLLKTVFIEALAKAGPIAGRIGDICVGNVLQPGGGAVMARIAQFLAGVSYEVPLSSVNRQCSSGLQAIANIYGAIKSGGIDAGIGAGAGA